MEYRSQKVSVMGHVTQARAIFAAVEQPGAGRAGFEAGGPVNEEAADVATPDAQGWQQGAGRPDRHCSPATPPRTRWWLAGDTLYVPASPAVHVMARCRSPACTSSSVA